MTFDARPLPATRHSWPIKSVLLIAGCCVAILPQAAQRQLPGQVAVAKRPAPPAEFPVRTARVAPAVAVESPAATQPDGHVIWPTTHVAASGPVAPVEPLDPIIIPLPAVVPIAAMPHIATAPLPRAAIAIDLPKPPVPELRIAGTPLPSPSLPADSDAPRVVDIAQISDNELPSLNVPQLHEPGAGPGGESTLSAKIAAMQVTPPPPIRIPDTERAALLAEAPTQMMVRIEGTALGKVDFRVAQDRTIAISLGELLDLLATHYDAAEFARLRNSAAADSYVSFDKLRSIGLNARYDPAYDEVRIAG